MESFQSGETPGRTTLCESIDATRLSSVASSNGDHFAITDQTTAQKSSSIQIDWRIRKYEVVLLMYAVVCVPLISGKLPFSPELAGYFFLRVFTYTAAVYAIACIIIAGRFIRWWLTRTSGASELHSKLRLFVPYFTVNFLLLTLRRGTAILGVLYLFLHLKHVILFIHFNNFDLTFWNLDRTIHFGIQPNIWLLERYGSNFDFATLFDQVYKWYFKYLILVSIFFLLEIRGRELTEKFFLAYTLLWGIGGLSYLIMPTDGPCYAILGPHSVPKEEQQHVFSFPVTSEVPASYVKAYNDSRIWIAKVYQEKLWHHRHRFLAGKELPGDFYGIAAMPSLHVAAVTMVAIFLFTASPPAGFFAIIFAVMVFIGSVFLQWHYAIDGYVGILLAISVSWVSLKWGGSCWSKKSAHLVSD